MKVQNPIIGRARGSAGGMTFCKNYDKNVARAKAFEVSNPKTPAQENQRTFFKELSSLVAQFSDEELRTLFPNKPKAMSRRNALSKQLAEDVTTVDNQKVVDYANIDTLGNAPTMDFGVTALSVDNGNFDVDLDESIINNPVIKDNLYFAALVNRTRGEIMLVPRFVSVEGQTLSGTLPSGWQNSDTMHAIPFITNATTQDQNVNGFGSVVVIKRPVKAA